MKPIRPGRLWQVDPKVSLDEHVRMALNYFGEKYCESFEVMAMKPEDHIDIQMES